MRYFDHVISEFFLYENVSQMFLDSKLVETITRSLWWVFSPLVTILKRDYAHLKTIVCLWRYYWVHSNNKYLHSARRKESLFKLKSFNVKCQSKYLSTYLIQYYLNSVENWLHFGICGKTIKYLLVQIQKNHLHLSYFLIQFLNVAASLSLE